MNTYVYITLDEKKRKHLASIIDGKNTGRLLKRAELRHLVEGYMDGLFNLNINDQQVEPEKQEDSKPVKRKGRVSKTVSQAKKDMEPYQKSSSRNPTIASLLIVDPEDMKILKDKDPGYIVGWNKVKRR